MDTRPYTPEERARQRAERYRDMNRLENVPCTRDLDRCIVMGVIRWLKDKGIRSPGDVVDTRTGQPLDQDATALLHRIVGAVKQSRFDMRSKKTRLRLFARLGIRTAAHPAAAPRRVQLAIGMANVISVFVNVLP